MKYAAISIWKRMQSPEEAEAFLRKLNDDDFERIFYFCLDDFLYFSPKDFIDRLLLVGKNKNKKIEVLVGISQFVNSTREPKSEYLERTFWDSYWLIKTYTKLKWQEQTTDFKYHYVSLNNRCHPWRCELIDIVAKNDLLKYGAVSWYDTNDAMYKPYEFKYFENKKMILTDNFINDLEQYATPEEYKHSFCQLVSESSTRIIEISEKTATPLILGKPFLVAGARLTSQLQTTMGFQLYTEIFDYSFDSCTNQTERFSKLVEDNLVKLAKFSLADLKELHTLVQEKIAFNKNRVREIVFSVDAWPDIARFVIDVYKTTGEVLAEEIVYLYNFVMANK